MHCSIQSILFLIAALKTVTGTEEIIYAQVGHDVTLKVPANLPKYDYKYWHVNKDADLRLAWANSMGGWFISDVSWKSQLSVSGDSLVIRGIHEENFGTYVYKVDSPAVPKLTYKLHKLTVNVSPALLLLLGDQMSLKCDVETRGEKKPTIYWQTPQGEKKSVQEARVITVKSQDNGEWTCVVVNDQKELKVKISIAVVEFSPAPQLQYTSASSQLNIPFSIHTHNSWEVIKTMIQEIQWSFIPKTPSDQIRQKLRSLSLVTNNVTDKQFRYAEDPGNFSLFREKGREDDQGAYECLITFKNGKTLTSTVQVEVLQIIPSPGATLTSGQKLEMHCTTGEPLPPELQLKWFPPKKSPFRAENISTRLIIKRVQIEDGGMWRCDLMREKTRLTSARIKLKIEPVLSVWMLVTICSAAAIIILLILLTVILCRRRKRNGRHIRHRLCRCENPKPKGFYRT